MAANSSGRLGNPLARPGLLRPGAVPAAAGGVSNTITVTETLTAATDSVSFVKSISVSRTVTETLTTASDSVSFTRGYPRTVAETTTTSDSVTRSQGISRSVSETLTTPTDSVTFVKGRYVYESVNGIDQVFVQVARPRTVTETLSATDLITKQVATSRQVNETIPAASDIVKAPVVNGHAAVTVLEYLNTFDTVVRSAGLFKTVAEPVGPSSDIVSRGSVTNRRINEVVIPATDAVTRQANLSRLIRESVPIHGDTIYGYQPRPALPTQDTITYYAEAFSRPNAATLTFKRTLGKILNRPVIKNTINGGQQQVTLEFASYADRSGVNVGDAIYLKERFTGQTIYGGYVSDAPESFSVHSTYQLIIDPFVTELGDNPFSTQPLGIDVAGSDVTEVVRAACLQTRLNYIDGLTIPSTIGVPMFFHFDASTTALRAIEECRLVAGPNYFHYVDHDGFLWFQQIHGMVGDTAHGYIFNDQPDWIARLGTDISHRTVKRSIQELKNYIIVNGGTPANRVTPLSVKYDQSASSPYGRRMLNPLNYSQVLDATTLQNIANTLGVSLNRVINHIEITLPKYGQQIEIGRPGGGLMSVYEPGSIAFNDQYVGTGVTGGPYVILDVEIDGPSQKVQLSDYPVTLSDLQGLLEGQLSRAAAVAPTPPSVGGYVPGSPSGCGGLTLLARGSSNAGGIASGTFSAGQASYVLDSGGNCQVLTVITLSINFTNPGPDVIIQGFCDQSGTGTSSGLFSIPARVPQDGHWHTVTLVIPATAPMADGTYSSYVTVTNGSGLYSSVYDVQAYLYSSGGSITQAGLGISPGSGTASPPAAGSVELAAGSFDSLKDINDGFNSGLTWYSNIIQGSQAEFPVIGGPVGSPYTVTTTANASYHFTMEMLGSAPIQTITAFLTLRPLTSPYAPVQTSPTQTFTVGPGTKQSGSFIVNLGPVGGTATASGNYIVALEMTGPGGPGGVLDSLHVTGGYSVTRV